MKAEKKNNRLPTVVLRGPNSMVSPRSLVLLNLHIKIKALVYVDSTFFLISNVAASGSQFSRPNGMEEGVYENCLE